MSTDGTTWIAATQTPTSANDTITVRSPHTVTVTANVDADQLTVDSGGKISVNGGVNFTIADGAGTDLTDNGAVATAGTITNNGQAAINDTLQIDQGGFPGGGAGTYAYDQTTGKLVFNNTSGSYGVGNDNYWPTTNGPQNVNVQGAGGITLNVARTVGLLFQYAAGVTNANNLTLNGTSQVNNGGFMSGSPTYGGSSLLRYNTGGTYGRNGEWLPGATGGAGYPFNVQLSNNTTLNLGSGSAGPFQSGGSLTIDSGSTMQLAGVSPLSQPLTVTGSVTINGALTLSTSLGGDIKVGGNWTRANTGTFTPNNRAVFFNGSGAQTVASGTGFETFNYLVVDKPSGNLVISSATPTFVQVNGISGDVLQLLNAGGIDLNGRGMSLINDNGNLLVSGGARSIFGIAGSTFSFTGSKTVTSAAGGTLSFGAGVLVEVFKMIDFGASLTTINGTLKMGNDETIAFVANNHPPTYAGGSTLLYECTCVYDRSAEWSTGSGPGYPFNVQVANGSGLNVGGATTAEMAGSMLVSNGGDLNLSTTPGGDLALGGNFTINGNFTNNGRTVIFRGDEPQTIMGTSLISFHGFRTLAGASVSSAVNFSVTGTWTNDGAYNGGSETVTFNGSSAQSIGGGNPSDFANVDITNASGVSLASSQNVKGNLGLTAADVTTGASVLTQPASGTSSGDFDVVGNVRRTGFATGGPALSFGNPNNQIRFTAGTAPTEVTVNLVKMRPMGAPMGFPNSVNRTYTITPNGGSGYTATLRLHYQDSELSGQPPVVEEGALDLWRFDGTKWQRVMKTNADPVTGNWIESNAVMQFSPWVLAAQPLAPTAAKLRSFGATHFEDGTLVEWETAREVNNLGFNLYRQDGRRRTLVTPSLVAGSALVAGPDTVLTAGNTYAWVDPQGTPASRYFLEDVDTGGKRTTHGPFTPVSAAGRMPARHQSQLLSRLGASVNGASVQRQLLSPTEQQDGAGAPAPTFRGRPTGGSPIERQRSLAAGPAVKLLVRRAGWYRVTRAQLEAAGLWPDVDPTQLRLYADGVAQAVSVNAEEWQGGGGAIEFYGEGLDTTSTDTRVYWLTDYEPRAGRRTAEPLDAGDGQPQPSLELAQPSLGAAQAAPAEAVAQADAGGAPARRASGVRLPPPLPLATSFAYTAERRERTIYFSGLLNGEAENFFGRVVSATPVTQTLAVRNLAAAADPASPSSLAVALQGVTEGAHSVRVLFNGGEVGTLNFAGRALGEATFTLDAGQLREGDNDVQLISGGAGDVSLTGHLRLTYAHSMRADDDALRFTAAGGAPVRVGGFTSPDVRVFDVSDPAAAFELAASVAPDPVGGGYAVTASASGTGRRTLLALTGARVSTVEGAHANEPSSWHSEEGADFVIITHANFRDALAPLAERREAEGLVTKIVNIADLFDEYSFGAHTPQAVRDFLAATAENWQRVPSYVLLAGDGSYDPRNHTGRGSFDLVPTKLLDTEHMETASDNWFADFDGSSVVGMSVGRLPVRTAEEAALVVSKLLNHAPDAATGRAVLVADRAGADGYSFEAATDELEGLLPATVAAERINRGTQAAESVRGQIVAAVNNGPALVNWMGHGSVGVWTGEGLLRTSDAAALQNGGRLPLFVMMTCLNGYYFDPSVESLSEALLKAEHGGAVAAWTSTGMTEPEGQAAMNRELYRALFEGTGTLRLGDAMQRARTATDDPDVLRTWVLIGDPTTRWR